MSGNQLHILSSLLQGDSLVRSINIHGKKIWKVITADHSPRFYFYRLSKRLYRLLINDNGLYKLDTAELDKLHGNDIIKRKFKNLNNEKCSNDSATKNTASVRSRKKPSLQAQPL